MNTTELISFCDAWISDEPSDTERAEYESKDELADDVTLYSSALRFRHGGRYEVNFGNQGFITEDFGESTYENEDERICSHFWNYCSSTDVWYYDAALKLEGNSAYAVAMLMDDFRKSGPFDDVSDALGDVFASVRIRDYTTLDGIIKKNGFIVNPDGTIECDMTKYGAICNLIISPLKNRIKV